MKILRSSELGGVSHLTVAPLDQLRIPFPRFDLENIDRHPPDAFRMPGSLSPCDIGATSLATRRPRLNRGCGVLVREDR